MPRRPRHNRIPWTDRFCSPTADELIAGVDRAHTATVRHARRGLLAAGGGLEVPVWCGVPWRWAITYRAPSDEKPWAYLIPQPDRPRLAIPLCVDLLINLPATRLSRYVRDGLTAAPQVERVVWGQWDLVEPAKTDELFSVACRRFGEVLAPVA